MSACVGLPLLSPKSSSTRNDSAGAPPSSAAPAKRKGSHGSNISSSIQIVNGALRHVLPPAKRQRGSRGDAVAIDVQQLALSSRDTDNGCPATATSPSKQTLVGEVASTSTRNSPRPSPARAKTRYFCQHPGCDKSYTKPVRLAEHERSHTGERPFGCPEEGCSASYLRETHLAAHLRTHRDESEKPLLCSEDGCDKRFWTNQHLKRHVRLVHEQDKDQYRVSGLLMSGSVRRGCSSSRVQEGRCTELTILATLHSPSRHFVSHHPYPVPAMSSRVQQASQAAKPCGERTHARRHEPLHLSAGRVQQVLQDWIKAAQPCEGARR